MLLFLEFLKPIWRNRLALGACNPRLAHEALAIEDKIGTMLPCNVIVQDADPGQLEVAAINPNVSMQAVDNPQLKVAAETVGKMLKAAIDNI